MKDKKAATGQQRELAHITAFTPPPPITVRLDAAPWSGLPEPEPAASPGGGGGAGIIVAGIVALGALYLITRK